MGGFFGPRPTPYDAGDRLSQLMQQRGQISSRAAEQSGQIWGNVVGGVGQALSHGVQQYGEDKKVREAEAKKQEQAGQMAKRDAAWVDYVNGGEWSKDPKQAYQTAMKVWGPKEGPVQFQALQSASTLMGPKRDPEKDMKAAGSIGGVLDKSPEPVRAKLYPGARTVLQNAFPDLALGEQYSTKEWDEVVKPLLAALPGEKPKGPMEVSQGASLVDPETGKVVYAGQPKSEPGFSLGPGDVRYDASGKVLASRPAAPKAAREQRLERVETIDPQTGKRVDKFVVPKEGDTYAKPSGSAKPATGQQKKALNYFNRSHEAQGIAVALENGDDLSSLRQKYTPELLNFTLSNPDQSYIQAQRAFTEARLRPESGAAIAKSEYEKDALTYFKQPGDSKETIAQKQRGRNAILAGRAVESGDALREYYGEEEASQLIADYKAGSTTRVAKPKAGPPAGAVVNGYRFKGGDPSSAGSWEPAK